MSFRKTVFLAVLVAATAASASDDLTTGEIRSELVGQEIAWWDSAGFMHGRLILSPDGQAVIAVDSPRASRDVGRWTVVGGELCTTWDRLRAGPPKCYRVRRGDAGLYHTSGGNTFEVLTTGV